MIFHLGEIIFPGKWKYILDNTQVIIVVYLFINKIALIFVHEIETSRENSLSLLHILHCDTISTINY